MPAVHRHGDSRICGATTTVQNQSTVFVNGQLWAVKDSTNTHGNGQLIPTGTTVFVEGKLVIVHTADNSQQDNRCPPDGPPHCNPKTAEGSGDVFAY
jgi:hypothetical protein